MTYEHLRLEKETPLTERHRRRGMGGAAPADPRAHGAALLRSFEEVRHQVDLQDVGGFDECRLLKIRLRAGETQLPDFAQIPGLEVVSQEEHTIVLAFATEAGLSEVEARLATLAREGAVTRKDLLYVIDGFDHWTPQDRQGAALRELGRPGVEHFVLDVELWPQDQPARREALMASFRDWCDGLGVERVDQIASASLLMVRLRCTNEQADSLLRHRDVRTVDLPPRHGLSLGLVLTDVNQFPAVEEPQGDAPTVAVLDSGLSTGHPLLGGAVGDAQGYVLPHRLPDDGDPWHGTFVGGLALYGDVERCIQDRRFVPELRLVSGRVFNDDGADQTEFVENAVERAVRELNELYGCRVFNLSYGDLNKVYDGRHIRGLGYTLDRLTRELGVLFVVSSGNLQLSALPDDARAQYPEYLFNEGSRLLDPGTALNVITVGGLARHEATREAQRYPGGIEAVPLARSDHPFPLTRRGPSIGGAIKPDLVEHAGNVASMRLPGRFELRGLGVVSLHGGFAGGHAFKEDVGTSFAAPLVANKAARLLRELPDATPNLLRAVIGAHAAWPSASKSLLDPAGKAAGRDKLTQLIGYGQVDDTALLRSLDNAVSLVTEESIAVDQCQFFEIPVPDDLWNGGRRTREVSVALAYTPVVRTTRMDYRMSKLRFTLVAADGLDEVSQAFQRNREVGMPERSSGRWLSGDVRQAGTLQVSRWTFRQRPREQKLFVVVTRQDANWSDVTDLDEPYALCVSIKDRDNADSRLYAQMRAMLQARVQLRARARV
ncbi:S8 family peptidase [Hydrogenophaga sp.]|uniref:S8 family peptidase n=1 Tax=Hydrogenophaga sp. TaxID=1904254 RepID=UPI00272F484E|nr:S8 family peptidase [Hydrogenophaga sp.]MDP2073400.1 S8 family peptidase [Hydrogenophaga sp.]MDP3106788.1 S8 family peptidase [Hydrogenophaga sp.]